MQIKTYLKFLPVV